MNNKPHLSNLWIVGKPVAVCIRSPFYVPQMLDPFHHLARRIARRRGLVLRNVKWVRES
jgi:hypothetical protein